ncbi:MAG TPA: NADH-quinone oxidoreductase subunit J [Candidatus Dormibacteraeota bacterium]|nr:NADH-quinone oxidoreductase subunit J [Candidatus Dormibacteraeota bacterium]
MAGSRLLFDFFAAIAAASALAMVTRRNIFPGAVFLLATLLATGGIVLQLQAEYAFAAQLLLFVGGIVLLFVLAVMLLIPDALHQPARFNWRMFASSALVLVVAIEILAFFWARHDAMLWPSVAAMPTNNTGAMGDVLFRDDFPAFEFASISLLATIVGVVMLAKRRTE